ncbi:helix-turn-helix transcriptional regulator [Microbispora corallina]|uniref:PadR family transcriptional regulator n=2 Tax=Microbispora corallina TaxID=83302 RepID=A0ABQ4G8A2_9ACTN|nr:PadR family transcriptional regulator [Microbispora corallina]
MLGLLTAGPASGYDLLKVFEISLNHVWPATQSQVYAELNRLAGAGLVKAAAEGPRGRKEYAITETGIAELRHWLTEVEPQRTHRFEALLRVFFLSELEPEQARTYLERQATAAEEDHAGLLELRESVSQGDDPLSLYGNIALEWGLRFTAMQREWADWAAERVASLNGLPAHPTAAAPPGGSPPSGAPPADPQADAPPAGRPA